MSADLGFLGERVTRVELAFSAWEADVLPLNYTRRNRYVTRRRQGRHPATVPADRGRPLHYPPSA